MNLNEAKYILSGPLVFGNPQQIEALRVMEMANEEAKLCSRCNGDGTIEVECPDCEGSGDYQP